MFYKKQFNRNKVPKEQSQQIHFKKRLKQRTGLEINRDGIENLVKQCQTTIPVYKQSIRVYIHKVNFNGTELFVAYDKQRKTLITVLHEKWVEQNLQGDKVNVAI